ncbi:hypothetical protein H0H87_005964 [Tephrocybe sp. NHM501043]|nr:hypothetical protein H0H87_005964 [Tephrocybe sp. NHM501043]
MLAAARCLRGPWASSSRLLRFNSTIPLASPASLTSDAAPRNLLDSLVAAQPPIGSAYPPPSPPEPRANNNPFEKKSLASYSPAKPHFSLYCQSTRNNTITTLMDNEFKPVAAFSGGSCGFKKVQRSSYEAGYQCAVRMFREIENAAKARDFDLHLYFKGFGQGRDAMHRALLTSEGEAVRGLVTRITDKTPIKIGGTRAKKARRLVRSLSRFP